MKNVENSLYAASERCSLVEGYPEELRLPTKTKDVLGRSQEYGERDPNAKTKDVLVFVALPAHFMFVEPRQSCSSAYIARAATVLFLC